MARQRRHFLLRGKRLVHLANNLMKRTGKRGLAKRLFNRRFATGRNLLVCLSLRVHVQLNFCWVFSRPLSNRNNAASAAV